MNKKEVVILTGDRPTGPLHLGHYVGSLANRVLLQNFHKQFIMIADIQALTDNYETPEKVRKNVIEVMLDYLAVGIDPELSTIFIQSMIPEIAELTIFYLNLVTIHRLERNPTVKMELQQKKFKDSISAGFLMYPVSQAADITIMQATSVPVGEDQLPMIEQTNEIVRTFNRIYKTDILVEAHAIIPKIARLPGIDGKAKMSKSLENGIYLSDSFDIIAKKVSKMYTDPHHIRIEDPGTIEGNTVFTYLDAFGSDIKKIEELKTAYRAGGLGDTIVKKYLLEILENLLIPIQDRRKLYCNNQDYLLQLLLKGTAKARAVAIKTMEQIKQVMQLTYYS